MDHEEHAYETAQVWKTKLLLGVMKTAQKHGTCLKWKVYWNG